MQRELSSNLLAIRESKTVCMAFRERATDTLTIKEFRLMVASAQEKIAILMYLYARPIANYLFKIALILTLRFRNISPNKNRDIFAVYVVIYFRINQY